MPSRRAFSMIILLFVLSSHGVFAIARYMQLIAPGQGWTVNTEGLWWTDDNGAHWKNISPPEARYFNDVFFLDASHGWALYASDGKKEGTLEFHVAITTDSGEAWSVAPIRVPSQQPDELDGTAFLDFADPIHGWVVMHAKSSSAFSWGLSAKTDDGGKTWNELPQVPTSGRPTFVTPLDGWIIGPSWNGIYRTHDGGKSWQGAGPPLTDLPTDLPTEPEYGPLRFTDSRHGFLPLVLTPGSDAENSRATAAVVYATSDGGDTWKRDRTFRLGVGRNVGLSAMADSTLVLIPLPDPKNPQGSPLIAIGSDGKVANLSSDILRADISPMDGLQALTFISATEGWASTKAGHLLSTADGGATWKRIGLRSQTSPAKNKGTRLKLQRLVPPNGPEPPSTPSGLYTARHLGFDTHNVLTAAAMQSWFDWSPFLNAAFYAGGSNYCGKSVNGKCVSRPDPGLSAGWALRGRVAPHTTYFSALTRAPRRDL
ncbi:MAG: hypothetical protein WB562_03490 [Candidatus Sulfotelmatobacter sp.]